MGVKIGGVKLNMDMLYIFGLIIGLLALYLLCTLGIGFFITAMHDDCDDVECSISLAYVFGCFIFLFLAIATLKAYNMVPGVEETVAVVRTVEEETEEIGD